MPRDWWLDWDLSYFPDVYGATYGGHSVQEAMYRTLDAWLPTYINEFNRQTGGGQQILNIPKRYSLEPEYRYLSRARDAQVLVVVKGTVGEPERFGNGQIRSVWEAEASVVLAGTKSWEETQALTYGYGVCVRTAIMQHRSLDGFAQLTQWMSERYLKMDHVAGRTLGMAVVDFEVIVENSMNTNGGPPLPQFAAEGENTGPTLTEQPNFPTVQDHDIKVWNEEVPS